MFGMYKMSKKKYNTKKLWEKSAPLYLNTQKNIKSNIAITLKDIKTLLLNFYPNKTLPKLQNYCLSILFNNIGGVLIRSEKLVS